MAVAAYLWGRPTWAVSVASSAGGAARQAGATVGSTAAAAGSSRADLGDTILANRATIEKAGFAIIAFAVVGLAVGIEIALLGAALIVGLELALNALGGKDSEDAGPDAADAGPTDASSVELSLRTRFGASTHQTHTENWRTSANLGGRARSAGLHQTLLDRPGGEGPSERAGGAQVIRTRWRLAAAGASLFMLGQLVVAAPVGATTGQATVTADMPSAVPAGRLWSFNDFFPRTVTVRAGSDLQFLNEGFHTFTVLPAGDTAKQDWQTNGAATDDTDDTALNPNGTTHAAFNIPALLPTCGPAPLPQCTFDGSSTINISPLGPPGPVDVHVTAQPGTYTFLCRIHPGMSGTLNVVAADAKVPSQAKVDQQVAKQVSKDLKGAWQADKKANHDAISQNKDGSRTLHVTAGTSSKDGKVALLEFFPRNLDAKPGDTVVFTPRSPNEPHT